MPYSITTKDGITIDDIPDDMPPDAQELKDQVAQTRAQMAEYKGEAPLTPEGEFVGEDVGMMESLKEAYTGEWRETPETQALPDWTGMPELNAPEMASFKAALGTMATQPEETVQIIKANYPDVQVRQDERGNYIMRSPSDNQEYAIKPGMQLGDIPRVAGTALAFTPAGRATTIPGAAGAAAGTQAAIEASQAATGGEVDPANIALAGLGGAALPVATQAIGKVAGAAAGAIEEGKKGIFKVLTPQKSKILDLVEQNADDVQRAGFTTKPAVFGGEKLAKDPNAQEAIRQGMDEGTVALIQSSSAADKALMKKALDVLQKGKASKTFAVANRPGDVAGEALKRRYDTVLKINKGAATEVNSAASRLKGTPANLSTPYNDFTSSLQDLGVSVVRGKNGKLKGLYENSEFAQSKGTQRILNDFIAKSESSQIDALDAHRIKRVIDGAVEYGRKSTKDPILSTAEGALKSLRRGINETLQGLSPEYKAANAKFSDTKQALDAFRDAAGPSFNPLSENASKQLVNTARSIMSNNQKRVPAMDAINALQESAKKYGATFDDDILKQAAFMDDLESLFGSRAPTSFGGQIEKAGARVIGGDTGGIKGIAVDVAEKGIQKARGINEENLVKALSKMLSEQ
jgi:hypothetical protein